jgi:hypothetical protein
VPRKDKQKAYRILMKEKEKWDTEIGKIESYLFAYNYLPEVLKDPFLDICSFFQRMGLGHSGRYCGRDLNWICWKVEHLSPEA